MLLFFIEDGEKAGWLGHANRDAYLRSLDLDPEMVEVALRGLQISDPDEAQPYARMVELGHTGADVLARSSTKYPRAGHQLSQRFGPLLVARGSCRRKENSSSGKAQDRDTLPSRLAKAVLFS
jgi:hypothetical protein